MLAVAGAMTSFTWHSKWIPLAAIAFSCICFFAVFRSGKLLTMTSALGAGSFSLGIALGPIAATYGGPEILRAAILCTSAMAMMSAVGIVFPSVFGGWGPYLTAALVILINISSSLLFVRLSTWGVPLFDWIGIGLFMAFVAFDWSSAIRNPHTLENAVWSSGMLFLDSVNIFLRALEANEQPHTHEVITGNSDRQ
jgi:FtsH-binding integral membrane protein